jgi:hypothetical protein
VAERGVSNGLAHPPERQRPRHYPADVLAPGLIIHEIAERRVDHGFERGRRPVNTSCWHCSRSRRATKRTPTRAIAGQRPPRCPPSSTWCGALRQSTSCRRPLDPSSLVALPSARSRSATNRLSDRWARRSPSWRRKLAKRSRPASARRDFHRPVAGRRRRHGDCGNGSHR